MLESVVSYQLLKNNQAEIFFSILVRMFSDATGYFSAYSVEIAKTPARSIRLMQSLDTTGVNDFLHLRKNIKSVMQRVKICNYELQRSFNLFIVVLSCCCHYSDNGRTSLHGGMSSFINLYICNHSFTLYGRL